MHSRVGYSDSMREGLRGSVEPDHAEYPKSVAIARVRVEPERHDRYMRAFERVRRELKDVSFSWCVREALDKWADGVLK